MTVNEASRDGSSYQLGHSGPEVDRLILQGRIFNPLSAHALRLAGLRPGMRVLDVGCGAGDVSFVAADIVGPAGAVIGLDAAPDAVRVARARAAGAGVGHVTFQEGTVLGVTLDEPVDAVVGRLILIHLPDPVAALKHLAGLVRPGGFVSFQDFDLGAVGSRPEVPLVTAVTEAMEEGFRARGADPAVGMGMYGLFRRAGLPAPRLTSATPLGGGEDEDLVLLLATTCRQLVGLGAVGPESVARLGNLDTLAERLRAGLLEAGAVMVTTTLVSAWSTLP
ncbi:methyltransferase domain-containing protein [Streptomyces liangshanensis]|uniref:Methyltransferase domain-containing protein n=1 Tax=Streptomyces liangshanensis TaxID=2717324 RepID=A0A6G9GRU6_9ACTN|nr:methyltransferase domain-containing protein [Streptomyces liangshanensis]QIQ00978.1 methyltransferase domain-containing protein [Streptomyces liangshanensis]